MAKILVALFAGAIFGAGLTISQMINPAKVLAFLNVTAAPSGNWDPSLAFVMAGALVTAIAGYRVVLRRARPIFALKFKVPTRRDIDWRLVVGATVFGLGWGLVGYCPGPAFAALTLGSGKTIAFIAAMLIGMAVYHVLFVRQNERTDTGDRSDKG